MDILLEVFWLEFLLRLNCGEPFKIWVGMIFMNDLNDENCYCKESLLLADLKAQPVYPRLVVINKTRTEYQKWPLGR